MLPIPIGTDRPQRHRPWMNYFIILANVICYLLSHTATHGAGATPSGLSPAWEPYMLYPTHLRLYQFITYQFLHENLSHIFFNMLFLYVFGNNLNEKLGHLGYLAFYLTGGVLAGCGQVLFSNAPTLGASGAISAVTGLFLVLLPRTNIRIFIWFFVYVDFWDIPSVYFIVFSVLKDFLEPLFWSETQTAHAAHLSGNLAGFIIGLILIFSHLVQRDHYDLLAMLARWRRRKQYESLVAGGYDPFSPAKSVALTAPRGKSAPPPPSPQILALREEITKAIQARTLPAAVAKYLELRALAPPPPQQVMPPDAQLDIANQLMTDGRYQDAAGAYEDYLGTYTTGSQHDQVLLLLGVIYGHYLSQPTRAIELFRSALPRLHDQKQKHWAEEEIAHLTPPPPSPPPPPPPPLK